MRKYASVQRVLPPYSSSSARSMMATFAPAVAAATAADNPAMPLPITSTSKFRCPSVISIPVSFWSFVGARLHITSYHLAPRSAQP
jgi:hypothetical protein